MKNKKLLFACCLVAGLTTQAQIKVYSGGNSVIGSAPTSAPTTAALQVIGVGVFSANTGAITSSAFINGNNSFSSATSPDYTWYNDGITGIFHPAASAIGFSIGGAERMKISGSTISFEAWTNAILDWTGGSGAPCFYPSTSGYLQLGSSTKFLGSCYIGHELYLTAPSLYSDRNVKNNINYNLDSTLIKLKQLKPASYNLKPELFKDFPPNKITEYCNRKQYGLIAQEVQAVFPELVETDSATGRLGVQYTNLIALLVDAVNKQQTQLDSFRQQLNTCCNSGTGNRSINKQDPTGTGQRTGSGQLGSTSDNTNNSAAMLYQNTPNPFNQSTVVKCYVPQSSQNASLLVFDLNGSLKKTFAINDKGTVNITINGNQLVSGMYYYTLLIDGQEIDTKKMILTE